MDPRGLRWSSVYGAAVARMVGEQRVARPSGTVTPHEWDGIVLSARREANAAADAWERIEVAEIARLEKPSC